MASRQMPVFFSFRPLEDQAMKVLEALGLSHALLLAVSQVTLLEAKAIPKPAPEDFTARHH
jgi:hypothetical protein